MHGEPVWDDVPETLRTLIAPLLAKDPAARPAPDAIVKSFAPPRGADRDWRRGPVAEDIKKREEDVRALLAPTQPSVGLQVSRRRLLTGFAAGGTLLATAGGTAAWLLRSQTTKKPDLFAFPPAVKTPAARVLSADEGDFVVGEPPKPLWGPVRVLHADSPAPLPVRDVIVFGAAAGGLAAHNVVDGKRRWAAADVHAPGRYLSLSDCLIAAVGTDGKLLTFVASTGEPKWTAPAEAAWLLAADDEAVYVVTKDRRVRAVGRSDARIRWTVELSASLAGKTGPRGVAGRGRLVVATVDGDVVALDTSDGRKVWDLRSQSEGLVRPAVADDTVYLNGRTLTARALADGKERWTAEVKLVSGENPPWGPPMVHGQFVFAVQGDWPRRLNRGDGSTGEWEALYKGGRLGPIVAQGSGWWTIQDTARREVQAVDVENGRLVWSYEQKSPKSSWITADGNRVFVVGDAELTALPVF
ncbi:PQQ-binding-like beta-propeller repeat protein [Streptomyces syringium]|uniref:outer membrane protein assembly factor BamB family protein n=1 Tax=Streptomyces syringium TaxID=76729 RepID=UPI003D8D4798